MAERSPASRAKDALRGRAASRPARRTPARLPKLDRLIHERIRLGIVSALAANDSLSFVELRRLLATTDGNLSVHARKLEEAGYITCAKRFEGRVPKSEYRITRAGRESLERYLTHLDALVRWAREGR